MKRRLEPNPNHALFFPSRAPNRQVVIGVPTSVWTWSREEFKHIDLASFTVTVNFGASPSNRPAKTADDLLCTVIAQFRFKLGERPEDLAKATSTCSTSRDVKGTIKSDFFQRQIQGTLDSVVETQLRQVSYLDLLTKPDAAKDLESRIAERARNQASEHGYVLEGCRVDVDPVPPDGVAFDRIPGLQDQWNRRLTTQEAFAAADRARRRRLQETEKKEDLAGELKLAEQEKDNAIEKQKLQNARAKSLGALGIEEKDREKEQKGRRIEIEKAMAEMDDQVQRQKIDYEQERQKRELMLGIELKKEQLESEFELDKARLDNEAKIKEKELTNQAKIKELELTYQAGQRAAALESLQHEIGEARLRLERSTIERQLVEIDRHRIETLGKAEAEVEREKVLATHAATTEMNKALLQALPSILEKAYAPTEKLGEIKVLYLGGRENSDSGATDKSPIGQALGSILSSMSTLPMLREVWEFLGDWNTKSGTMRQVDGKPALVPSEVDSTNKT